MPATARRWLLLALVGGACAACAPGPPPASRPAAAVAVPAPRATNAAEEERARYIARALAGNRLPGLEGLRRIGTASGFYIASDKIITNFHAAGACRMLTVGNGVEGDEMLAKLVAGDPAEDLAVLATGAVVAEPARFETALYTETGEGLAIVGYPEHGLSVLEAELSPVAAPQRELASDRAKFQFRGSVRRGNSGSPVLDDSGAVIGIVEAKIDTISVYQRTGNVVDNIGVAISNRVVLDFLRNNGIGYLPAVPAPSLTPAQLLQRAHGFVRQIGCWK